MKRASVIVVLVAATLVVGGCQWQGTTRLTVTQFRLTNETVQVAPSTPIEKPIWMTIRHELTDENNGVSNVILAEGQLVDGELVLTQSVAEPTEVVISVRVGIDGDDAETSALLRPDTEIDFVVFHEKFRNRQHSFVRIKGKDHRSLDESRRFSIKGNLSRLREFDPKLVHVALRARPSVLDRTGETINFGPVLVDEGDFSLEGDIDEPTVFSISISEFPVFFGHVDTLHAIVEPGVNYRVVPWGSLGKYAVVADRDSLHTQLVSSWQFNPEFVALGETFVDARIDASMGMDARSRDKHEKEMLGSYQVADQCGHVSLSNQVKSKFIERYRYPFQDSADLLVQTRSKATRRLLRDTQDPKIARLIFELHWLRMNSDEIPSEFKEEEKVASLIELTGKMDQGFIDEYITPLIERSNYARTSSIVNKSIAPGQLAPAFTLTNIEGDEVSLSEVLSEKEIVLIHFWASWFRSSSEVFPKFEEIYSTYKEEGFEIVTVSLDYTFEAWASASKELDVPWIDLVDIEFDEIENGDRLMATAYGVREIPNEILIDNKGCILDKRFSIEELEKTLQALLN